MTTQETRTKKNNHTFSAASFCPFRSSFTTAAAAATTAAATKTAATIAAAAATTMTTGAEAQANQLCKQNN